MSTIMLVHIKHGLFLFLARQDYHIPRGALPNTLNKNQDSIRNMKLCDRIMATRLLKLTVL